MTPINRNIQNRPTNAEKVFVYVLYGVGFGILGAWLLNRFYLPPPNMIGPVAASILATSFWAGALVGLAFAWGYIRVASRLFYNLQ